MTLNTSDLFKATGLSNIFLITGKDVFHESSPKLNYQLRRIGDGTKDVQISDLEGLTPSEVGIIAAHGKFIKKDETSPNSTKLAAMRLIENHVLTSDQIVLLQQKLGIRHFYLFSCHAGTLPRSWADFKDKLQENTTITIFSSGKYGALSSLHESLVRKIRAFYKKHENLPTEKIDRDFFIKYGLFSPWTVVRCEVTGLGKEKKFTAFKVHAPKKIEDILDYSNYVHKENKINPMVVEDNSALNNWIEQATLKCKVNLEKYKNYSLIDSAFRGKLERVEAWIKMKPMINLNLASSMINVTALHLASMYGHKEIAQVLIQAEADIHHKTDDGATALFRACQRGHSEIVEMLIQANASIDEPDDYDATPLCTACDQGHDAVVQLLIDAGADVNWETIKGWTPLHIAAAQDHLDIVHHLLTQGASIDYQNDKKITALHRACTHASTEMVQCLLENGAAINQQDYTGEAPLHKACKADREDIVQYLLEHGASVDLQTVEDVTALHIASKYGYPEIVRLLIDAGADINLPLKDGRTPLYLAWKKGYTEIVQMLSGKMS